MGIWSFVTGIFSPVTDLIGKVVTKEEDILKVRNAIATAEHEMASKLIEYETKLLESKTKVIVADAKGESWLQRCWRPIANLTFLALAVADAFGLVKLTPQAWTLLTIGMGGGIIGRTFDKNIPHLANKNKPN